MASSLSSGAVAQIPPSIPVTSYALVTDTTGQTLYTVPANRTFYCTGMSIIPSGGNYDVYLKVGGTDIMRLLGLDSQPIEPQGFPIFVATAGQTVVGRMAAGGTTAFFNIWGFIL